MATLDERAEEYAADVASGKYTVLPATEDNMLRLAFLTGYRSAIEDAAKAIWGTNASEESRGLFVELGECEAAIRALAATPPPPAAGPRTA